MRVNDTGFRPVRHRKPGVVFLGALILSAALRLSAHPASDTSVVIALRDRQTLEIAVASDAGRACRQARSAGWDSVVGDGAE
jgi:hypothetical protein